MRKVEEAVILQWNKEQEFTDLSRAKKQEKLELLVEEA